MEKSSAILPWQRDRKRVLGQGGLRTSGFKHVHVEPSNGKNDGVLLGVEAVGGWGGRCW